MDTIVSIMYCTFHVVCHQLQANYKLVEAQKEWGSSQEQKTWFDQQTRKNMHDIIIDFCLLSINCNSVCDPLNKDSSIP